MSEKSPTSTDPLASNTWDVVIIGTGMGGATVGWALVQRGLSVLFLEKGTRHEAYRSAQATETPETRLAQGYWPHPMTLQRPDGSRHRFHAPVGCALGGSSIHYAGALERMAASDFEPLCTSTNQTIRWPVAYGDFVPFYEDAESLYGIARESDMTRESRFSEWDRGLARALRDKGLQASTCHVAMGYDVACRECIGIICDRGCKVDARRACLDLALQQPGCEILDNCDVQLLEADERRVHAVRAIHHGRPIDIRARVVVLAAGGYHSPQLLLSSRNSLWPNGLANRSDQVGRNLMFHGVELYALWAPRRLDRRGLARKALSIRDFYVHDSMRLGMVQSMGLEAGRGNIAMILKDSLRRRGLQNAFLLSLLVKVPSHVAEWLLGSAKIFAATTEDDPHPDNRIVLDDSEPNGSSFTYTITDDLRDRANRLHRVFAEHAKPWRVVRLNQQLTVNYGHPCGTCRFGDDPVTSVLNRDCRSHEVENLFVVDASFMPRSGAVNPSLTIAANALRVAPKIAAAVASSAAELRQ